MIKEDCEHYRIKLTESEYTKDTEKYSICAASEIVCSPFIKFCRMCVQCCVRKGYTLFDFGTDNLHRCSGSKAERLKAMNRRVV